MNEDWVRDNINGIKDGSISVPVAPHTHEPVIASADTLGSIKVGEGLSITADGTLNSHGVQRVFIVTIDGTLENGSITFTPSATLSGGSITATMTGAEGYGVDKVYVDGVEQEGHPETYTFENMTEDHTISATFELIPKYTFTISGSTPDGITYADTALSMTEAERRTLVRSIARHAVVKYESGAPTVKYWLDPTNLAKKEDGTSSDLTGTDGDVMLLFSKVFWTVTKSGSDITISFAQRRFSSSAVSAHMYGDKLCSYVGLGVFEGLIQSSTLRSVNSSSGPTVSTTEPNFYAAAINGRDAHYNVELPMTRMLWEILLLFEHGTRSTQTKVGYGRVNTTSAGAVNQSWDAANAWNKGNTGSSSNDGVTCCGLHNPWGNVWEFLGEFIYRDGTSYFSIQGGKDHHSITGGYTNRPSSWRAVSGGTFTTDSYIKDVCGDACAPFIPSATGGSSSTYFCDNAWQSTGEDKCCFVGADWRDAAKAGAFAWNVSDVASYSYAYIGARLHVMIE